MKPLRFRAENYHDFETVDVTFPDGPFAIVGLNGSGKSSIALGPDLCLFGAISRSLASELPRSNPTAELMIELTFEHDGRLYRVRRGFAPAGRGKATADFEMQAQGHADGLFVPLTRETIKGTDALICQTIGMSRDTYRNSVFLAQGARSIADPSIKPQARREIFFGALQLDRKWTPFMVKARGCLRETETQLQELTGRVRTLEETIAGRGEIESRAADARELSRLAEVDAVSSEGAVKALQAKIAETEKDESRRREYEARLKAAETTWQGFEDINVLAVDASRGLEALAPQIIAVEYVATGREASEQFIAASESEREKVAVTIREAEDWIARVDRRDAEIAKLKAVAVVADDAALAVKTGGTKTCERCGQSLPDAAADFTRATYLSEAAVALARAQELLGEQAAEPHAPLPPVTELEARRTWLIASIAKERETLTKAQAAEVSLASLNAQAASHREHVAKAQAPGHEMAKQAAEVELQAARDALAEIVKTAPVDVAELRRASESAGYRLSTAQTAARTAHDEVVRAEAEIERIAKAESDLAASAVERERLNADHDLYCQLERACGKTGVPLWIVENVAIPAVEEETARALREFGAPFRVEYRTLRETKDGELADALDIIVITEDGEGPLESFSGGEASRIIPPIQRGFAYFLRERCGVDAPTLFMDELAYLDEPGRVAYVDYLHSLIDAGQYQSIGVISHDPEVRDAFDTVIEIRKENGRSEVVA